MVNGLKLTTLKNIFKKIEKRIFDEHFRPGQLIGT